MKVLEVLALDALQAGMKIAEAVVDDGGRILVPAGAEITDSMLISLRRREVTSVKVELQIEQDPAILEAQRIVISTRLDRIFRKTGDSVETRTLYQAVLDHRMENPQ